MAARDGQVGYDQLHHFIASGAWNAVPLEKVLLAEADKMVGSDDAWLIIDDTALPKKGERSVGVAPQYASSLGKTANCQSLVSMTLASREVPMMVGLRLFLPETWTDDPERMTRAHVPKDRQTALTKPEIAIQEIDRVIASGVRFGCVLADSGYGSSGPFRQALNERGLLWAVGLSRRQNVYPADVYDCRKCRFDRHFFAHLGARATAGATGVLGFVTRPGKLPTVIQADRHVTCCRPVDAARPTCSRA